MIPSVRMLPLLPTVAILACGAGDAPPKDAADSGLAVDGVDTADTGETADTAGSTSYPAWSPPGSTEGHIGAYHWAPDTTGWPGSPDVLTWGVDALADRGARTIRLTLSARDDYEGSNLGNTRLVEIAASEHWEAILTSGRFDTVLLTTYTADDIASAWADGYTDAEVDAERDAIADLGEWLLTSAPGVTFVILNWEGDNALAPWGSDEVAWDGYARWIEARVQGVEAARGRVPDSQARLYSGLEFNAVDDLTTGAPCGSVARDCVVSTVAPTARVDVYSYSAWQSDSVSVADEDLGGRVSTDLERLYAILVAGHPALRRDQLLVGEYGAMRDYFDECHAASRTATVTQAILTWGVGLGLYWQTFDNPGEQTWYGYGLTTRYGRETLTGAWLRALWAGEAPADPPSTCGHLNDGGVCDGSTWDDQILPGDTISVFGHGFADSGNVAHFDEAGLLAVAGAGTPWWYESEGQVNVTLPAALGPGVDVRVWLTTPEGWESNAQRFTILAD